MSSGEIGVSIQAGKVYIIKTIVIRALCLKVNWINVNKAKGKCGDNIWLTVSR